MKFEIELSIATLKTAMAGLGKVINRSSGLPVLHCIRMIRDERGFVLLQATDLDCSATFCVPPPAQNAVNGVIGQMLVPWDSFTKAVKTNKERAAFVQEGDDQVLVRSFVGSMPIEEPVTVPKNDEWPQVIVIDGPAIELSEQFPARFKEAQLCASTGETRTILNGVCLDLSIPDTHYLVATNGKHLYSANSFAFDLKQSITVPTYKFLAWSGFIEDGRWNLRVKPGERQLHPAGAEISSDQWIFTFRLKEETYPNWRQIIPRGEPVTHIRFSDEAIDVLLEAVPRMPTDAQYSTIRLIVRGKTFVIAGRQTQSQPWTELEIAGVEINGPNTESHLNRDFLLKALRLGLNQLELRDPTDVLLFHHDGRRLAVAPLRFDPNSKPAPSTPSPTTPAEAASPSAPEPEETLTTDRTVTMQTTTITAPKRSNITAVTPEPEEQSAFKTAVGRIESARARLKEVNNELAEALAHLRTAEKDQKSTVKEIESVRATLRSLQKVQI